MEINGCIFSHNFSGYATAIYATSNLMSGKGSITLIDNVFVNNSASKYFSNASIGAIYINRINFVVMNKNIIRGNYSETCVGGAKITDVDSIIIFNNLIAKDNFKA